MYRVALGYDLHRLKIAENSIIICGGIEIPCDLAIDGAHSDGDVIFHALTDALFSVVGKDIGVEFPNTDPQNLNRSSNEFLSCAFDSIKNSHCIVNIDIVVICDKPKIAVYSLEIRKNIASLLQMAIEDVTIRGKTTEQTNPFTIQAYTNVLFQKKSNK